MNRPWATDATAFLGRLVRLDPVAPCRLVATGDGTALWAPLPWDVLVTRQVAAALPEGVRPAADLLAALEAGKAAPPAGDAGAWRWGLPAAGGEEIERVPAPEVARLGEAAEQTLRTVAGGGLSGRAVGQRAVRDALLDHVPLTVETRGRTVGVPQRLVQAVVRMGFLGSSPSVDSTVAVRVLPGWVGLAASYGTGWWHRVSRLPVRPVGQAPHRH
ncbi:MAG TPA: hypothetical protein VHA75_13635 [Rugosimonospora sp.]|nr:hypothetical protein [Rugosimonospora sp.]